MHWSHREVRRLLNYLNHPKKLESEPLAILLREATGDKSAHAAVTVIVDRALAGNDPAAAFMRSVVGKPDFGATKSRRAAAALGLSVRSYFRYRAAAIDEVAREIDRELRAKPRKTKYELQLAEMVSSFEPRVAFDSFARALEKPHDEMAYEMLLIALKAGRPITREMVERCEGPWRTLAMAALGRARHIAGSTKLAQRWRNRIDRALAKPNTPADHHAAFELARFDRLEAIRRCDMAAAREAVHRMGWHARSNSELAGLAMVVEVEQACDDGDLSRASGVLERLAKLNAGSGDLRLMGRTAHAQGILALMQCQWDQAWNLARLAAAALSEAESGLSIFAHVNVARAALQLGEPWSPPVELTSRFPGSWITGMIHAMHGRHLLGSDSAVATQAIERAIRITTSQGAPGMLSCAQASMAFAVERQGNTEEAQGLRVAAWETAIKLGCRSYLHDIFVHPAAAGREFGVFDLDNAFIQTVVRRARDIRIAQTGSCLPLQFAFIQWLVQAALGKATSRAPRFAINASQRARLAEMLAAQLARDLAICLNFDEREAFTNRFVGRMRALATPNANPAHGDLTAAS